jgi:excisionase family DNA binding protein
MAPDLIGSAEVAELLYISQRSVHRLVIKGELTPALTAHAGGNGTYLFHRSDVEHLAKGRTA